VEKKLVLLHLSRHSPYLQLFATDVPSQIGHINFPVVRELTSHRPATVVHVVLLPVFLVSLAFSYFFKTEMRVMMWSGCDSHTGVVVLGIASNAPPVVFSGYYWALHSFVLFPDQFLSYLVLT
jgi:hypothetical protein